MKTAAQLMSELNVEIASMDAGSVEYGSLVQKLAEAEVAYETEFTKAEIGLIDQYKRDGEKLPSEKTRDRLIHSKLDPSLWGGVLQMKARVEALDKWIRVRQSIIGAVQSQLSYMKTEASL